MAPLSRLFTPGPTPVPAAVLQALAQPMVHHRSAEFAALLTEVRANLRWLFQTEQEVLCLSCSGTGAMDAAVCNLLSPGDTALYVHGGRFGARWGDILRAYGVVAVPIEVAWGQPVDPAACAAALRQHPQAAALFVQSCETSTATLHPVRELAALCRRSPQTLLVVDAITSLGIDDLSLDRDGFDVLLSCSQKALMLPPGLSFLAMSPRARQRCEAAKLPRFYFDLRRELAAVQQKTTAWTSSVSLLFGLQVSLRLMVAEGLPALFGRHAELARCCRDGLQNMGWTLYSDAPANGLTAALPPPSQKASDLAQQLQQRFALRVGTGQEQAKGKILRFAHMGHVDRLCLEGLFAALRLCALE
jgi:aspartate aminotransferase-like enzyme